MGCQETNTQDTSTFREWNKIKWKYGDNRGRSDRNGDKGFRNKNMARKHVKCTGNNGWGSAGRSDQRQLCILRPERGRSRCPRWSRSHQIGRLDVRRSRYGFFGVLNFNAPTWIFPVEEQLAVLNALASNIATWIPNDNKKHQRYNL